MGRRACPPLCVSEELDDSGKRRRACDAGRTTTRTHIIQTDWIRFGTDGLSGKWTYAYDAQGRLTTMHRNRHCRRRSSGATTRPASYEPGRGDGRVRGASRTDIFDVQDDRLVRREGPLEAPVGDWRSIRNARIRRERSADQR